MTRSFKIGSRKVGAGEPAFIVAEISANHNGSFDSAVALIHAAKQAGADAVKLQTYTADTLTFRSHQEHFRVNGTVWNGKTLHELYQEAYTPWEWQPRLKKIAEKSGLQLFSSVFDESSVDFLERMDVPAYKISSFELVDVGLIARVARTRKPMVLSTGMATQAEIAEALATARRAGAKKMALLKCTSSYPAPMESLDLRGIEWLRKEFRVPVGFSDHTLGAVAAVCAVSLGGCIIEKHLTLSRSRGGPDSTFSAEPEEFREMVSQIRAAEKALGKTGWQRIPADAKSRALRKSLFVVRDMQRGDKFSTENLRCIRPGCGLHPRYLKKALGKRAAVPIQAGTPLTAELFS